MQHRTLLSLWRRSMLGWMIMRHCRHYRPCYFKLSRRYERLHPALDATRIDTAVFHAVSEAKPNVLPLHSITSSTLPHLCSLLPATVQTHLNVLLSGQLLPRLQR